MADPDGSRPGPATGTWSWLAGLGPDDLAAGVRVDHPAGLPTSAAVATEVAALDERGAHTPESVWARLTVARAAVAVGGGAPFEDPVTALAAHDARRHTAYLVSLAAWLDHAGEPTAAAKTIGVHVNTLRHRMVRMSEVTPLHLDDPVERLALRLRLAARGL